MEKEEAVRFVRSVLSKLDETQCGRALRGGRASGFHHGGAWYGPGEVVAFGPCISAAAFNLKPDQSAKGWWGAKVDKNALACYEFLLRAAGGDAGTAKFTEATMALSDAELLEILDEVMARRKGSKGKVKSAGRGR